MSIWLPLVRHLSFECVILSIPIRQVNNRYFLINEKDIYTNKMMIDLKKYRNNISFTQTKICFGSSTNSQQFKHFICRLRDCTSLEIEQYCFTPKKTYIGLHNYACKRILISTTTHPEYQQ